MFTTFLAPVFCLRFCHVNAAYHDLERVVAKITSAPQPTLKPIEIMCTNYH
jgi:hypothetical protein